DPGEVALLRLREGVRADDVPEEAHTRRVDLEVALDRRAEVARLHRRAVRVLEALAQRERVRLAVRRDLRQGLRQVRDDRRAVRAADVLVAEEGQVDVPHDRPTLDGVRQAGIEVVGAGVVGDAEVGERLVLATSVRAWLVAGALALAS